MKISKFIKNPMLLIPALMSREFFNWLPDKPYLQLRFYGQMQKKLDLKNPKTFNEKLQWLKLYDRKPQYTLMVDKYEAKKYIARMIGEEYVIPTFGVWERFEDIDFDMLPSQFVLKCTHDSGGLVICRDKTTFDKETARKKINKCLKSNYFKKYREWPYKDVKPRIIAEQYIEDTPGEALLDLKFFCFGGEPKVMYISRDKAEDPRTDFFDMEFNHLNIRMRDRNAEVLPEKPAYFDEMRKLAAELSANIPHLRVDFYLCDEKIYVGEMTFFHCAGFAQINPPEWDVQLGEWIKLPNKMHNKSAGSVENVNKVGVK